MGHKSDTVDARLSEIATRQHGVMTLRQLEAAGLTRYVAAQRAKKAQLHRIHRGVYAVGHRAPSWHRRWMAAVLACGEGAVLSHGSAASLWGLLKPIEGPIHVSIPSTSGRKTRRGIHVHRCPSLRTPSLVTLRDNIPVTTVGRTVEDLRASSLISSHLVRRAIRQAELKGLRLDGIETDRTRSDLESAFLALFADHPSHNPRSIPS
jgi:predicted transcriptional regulator of viral defense system